MIQKDENFVSMCQAVQDVLTHHHATWSTNVAFNNHATKYGLTLTDLYEAMKGTEIVSTGATDAKNQAELSAISLGVDIAKRASIYALDKDDLELHDQLRVSKSSLLRRPDTITLTKLQDIHDRIVPLLGDLGDYGVDAGMLAELQTAITKYGDLIARPRVLIVERKGHNQAIIPSLLASLREILYKMDSLVNLFKGTPFPTDYKNARIIVDLGGGGAVTPSPEG